MANEKWAAAAAMVCIPALLHAQDPTPPSRVPEISVVATRIEQPLDEVAASVSVTDAEQMERMLAKGLRDLARYEPNIFVTSDPNRFGATGFNIRGLSDNRVLMLVDGIRVPDFFSFGPGPFNVATRNLVDIDSLKRAEVLRGPASSLYGSDALGGVVAFITKDPKDYLADSDRGWYPSARTSWSEADRSWNNTATFATGGETLGGMLVYTRRDGHEMETHGDNESVSSGRTVANPQSSTADNLLAKFVVTPGEDHTFRLTAERFTSDIQTELLSLNSVTPRTSALTGDDETERWRVSLDHEYQNPADGWLAQARWSLYVQDSETIERSEEMRSNTSAGCSGITSGTSTCRIPREFTFDQEVTGANVQLDTLLGSGNATHRLIYGADYTLTTTSSLRDATVFNLTTGTTTRSLAGDSFPVRDFPESDAQRIGVFVQDQIALADARLLITPALRFEHYDLEVKPDAIYLANTPPNIQASDFSDSAFSPKIAALYKLTSRTSVYAHYAHGFRSPPFSDLNASFRNPLQSYVLIPNPDLESETSRGVEAGVRAEYAGVRFGVTAFHTRYRDFIDTSAALTCPDDPACVPGFASTFQSVNRAQVRIWGLEGKAEYALENGWSTVASVGFTRGDDLTEDQPINSVNPLKGVIGLNYDDTAERWGGSLILTAMERQRRVDETSGPLFRSPGFAIVDLTGYWNITPQATLTGGAFNLLDRKYWLWSDVSRTALSPTNPALDRYTQPPRNVAVSFKYAF